MKRAYAYCVLLSLSPLAQAIVPPTGWSNTDYDLFLDDCIVGSARLLNASDTRPGGGLCDSYAQDLYERPTSTDGSVYYPQIDIARIGVGLDNIWFYYSMDLNGVDTNGNLGAAYGYEIDFDFDGRGDFYVAIVDASAPEIKSGWSTKDVSMWKDTDNDVGGNDPLVANDPFASQDGYDTQKFPTNNEAGTGASQSDAVWARISPSDSSIIEMAIKQSFVGNPATAGSLRGWATKGNQSAGQFYFHDYYDNAQIGDAYPSQPHFPPSNFSEGDNSGGVGEDFTATLIGVELTATTVTGAICLNEAISYADITVSNTANGGTDTINLSATSTVNLRVELFTQNGATLLARDDSGDGTWDWVDAGADSDSDGRPDTGDVAGGTDTLYQLRLTSTFASAEGVDTTALVGQSKKDTSVTDTLSLQTTITVCTPILSLNKIYQVLQDPINGTVNPQTIPQAEVMYTINSSNSGDGYTGPDSVLLTDSLSGFLELYVGDFSFSEPPMAGSGPVEFTDLTPSSGLTYQYTSLASTTDSLYFSNNNGVDYNYIPTPNAESYDSNITNIRIQLFGAFNKASGTSMPAFELRMKTRIK